MNRPFRYNATTVAIAMGLIAVSTAVLSYFSYVQWGVGKENLVDTNLVQSNMRLASQCVDRIEQKIITNDGILSEMVDVDDPSTWETTAESIKRGDFNVDHVFIFRLDKDIPVFPHYTNEIKNSWGAVCASYKELNRRQLVANQTNHLHKERSDNYFFASYVLKEDRRGEQYLVFFQMNIDKTLALADRYVRDLQAVFYVSIVDFDNNGVYSQPIPRSKYFFEMRFPTTLYKWLLQVVPRNYTEMERNARNQRRANLFLIILSMSLIFCSLAIIYVAGRKERQLTQLKEDFISNVSHELKTPLSLIRMFSEILVTGRVKSDAVKQEYYGIIHSESDRMGRLIANLLDFARLERERHSLHFERTNIAQLVIKELEAFRYQIQKEGFELVTRVNNNVPDTLADPNAISMAFFNLLDNAVKYSGERKQVTVSVSQSNGSVDLAVKDEGLGIPEAERQRIFEKFFRGSSASVKRIRGSGIGLSLTKQVAEMHGGEIRVESEVGRGSTFTMRIPIREEPLPALKGKSSKTEL
ncbi:MAG: HAMP domain-containing histidine kinase [Acidobacteriia bacterium]|nr:HAMP domain-containing histidine kinase [Terriglobia bacterium]